MPSPATSVSEGQSGVLPPKIFVLGSVKSGKTMATAIGALSADDKRALTLVPRTLGAPRPIPCFERTGESYVYPAFHKPHPRPAGVPEPPRIDFPPFRAELREEQAGVVDEVCSALETDGASMCVLPTGYGKTVVALAVAARMSVRTLVVVHTNVLLKQWQSRADDFVCSVARGTSDAPLALEMLQTLRVRPPTDTFGLVIYDEAHHMCARAFSRVMLKVRPRYALGLSATATRADGMHSMLPLFFGASVTRTCLALTCAVQPLRVTNGVRAHTTMNRAIGKHCVNIARLITDLSECAERTRAVVDAVVTLVSRGRKVLVITQRRAHCTEMCASISARGIECAAMLGGSSTTPCACDAIVGTTGVVQEGFDVPWLDTLVFATPQVAVVQAIGRILRRTNTNTPLVIDLVDAHIPSLVGQYRKRRLQYLSGGHALLDMRDGI
jgi:superfamily II DNA or RNA helicase